MATHYVKCLYCNKYFDRDKEPFVKVNSRRYAHKMCAEHPELIEKTQEEKEGEIL